MTTLTQIQNLHSNIEIRHDLKIIVARFSGEFTVKEEQPIGLEVRKMAFDFGYKVMFDFREVVVKVSILETYEFPRSTYPIDLFRIKSVHLVNKKDEEFWNFAETTFKNAGVNVKVFYDKSKAMDWLKDEL